MDIKLSDINKNGIKTCTTGFPDTNAVIIHSTTGFEHLYLEDYLYKLKAFNLETSSLLAVIIL